MNDIVHAGSQASKTLTLDGERYEDTAGRRVQFTYPLPVGPNRSTRRARRPSRGVEVTRLAAAKPKKKGKGGYKRRRAAVRALHARWDDDWAALRAVWLASAGLPVSS